MSVMSSSYPFLSMRATCPRLCRPARPWDALKPCLSRPHRPKRLRPLLYRLHAPVPLPPLPPRPPGVTVFLPGICMHQPACTPYVLASPFAYALDHLLRALQTRLASAMPDLCGGTTRIEIPPSTAAGVRGSTCASASSRAGSGGSGGRRAASTCFKNKEVNQEKKSCYRTHACSS